MAGADNTRKTTSAILGVILILALSACSGGSTATTPDVITECLKDSHCDEQGPCFSGQCVEGACVYTGAAGANCDDGDTCTEDTVCGEDGSCGGGKSVELDNEPCASCSCDPEFGIQCVAVPVGQFCDDGDCCTTSEKCVACAPGDAGCNQAGRVCQGAPADCSDDNDCTADSCDCATGSQVCDHAPREDGSLCDLSPNDCTEQDTCQSGLCGPGDPLVLTDNNPCTYDHCDKGEVKHDPLLTGQCDDGDACTSLDSCHLGSCLGGEAVTCELPECGSSAYCDSELGCVVSWMPAGATCDDGVACTLGTVCTENHLCQGSETTCDDGKECTLDSCDTSTGDCVFAPTVGACEDGNLCTGAGSCQPDGSCATGTLLDCSSVSVSCIQPVCNPATGACDLVAQDGTPCPDGNLCNGTETCQSGLCSQPGTPVDCSGQTDPCLSDQCNTWTGQCDVPVDDGTACGVGDLCSGAAICQTGICTPGNDAVDCSQVVDPCLQTACNSLTGACDLPAEYGTPCTFDSDPCTWDVCDNGSCAHLPRPGVVELSDQGLSVQTRDLSLRDGGRVVILAKLLNGTPVLFQLNGLGIVEWTRMDLGLAPTVKVRALKSLPDGGLVLAGWDEAGPAGLWDGWLMHTDAEGQNETVYTYGGTAEESFRDVIVNDDGSLLLVGTWRGPGLSVLVRKGWAVRTDTSFSSVWNKQLKQFDAAAHQLHRGVKAPGSPGYFLVGEHLYEGSSSGWMLRIDDQGAVEWQDFDASADINQAWTDVAVSGVTTPYFMLAGKQILGGLTEPWFAGRTLAADFDWNFVLSNPPGVVATQVSRLIHHSVVGGGAVAVGSEDNKMWLALVAANGAVVVPSWVEVQALDGGLSDVGQKTDLGFGLTATGNGRVLFMDHDGNLCGAEP